MGGETGGERSGETGGEMVARRMDRDGRVWWRDGVMAICARSVYGDLTVVWVYKVWLMIEYSRMGMPALNGVRREEQWEGGK